MKITSFFFFFISLSFSQEILSLDDCINMGLKHNRNLKISKLNLLTAKEDKKNSFSSILPQIGMSFNNNQQGSYTSYQYGIKVPESTYFSNSIYLNQTIYDGGNWWNQISLYDNLYKQTYQNMQSMKNQVVLNIKKAFFEYLKNKELYEVSKKQLELSEQQLERVQRQFEVEAVAKTDLLKQQVLLGQVKVQLLNQNATLLNSKKILAETIGFNINKNFDVTNEYPQTNVLIESKDQLWDLVFEKNPDIIQKKNQIMVSKIQVKIAKSQFYPSISANVGYGGSADEFDLLYSDVEKFWQGNMGISINLPIFTGRQRSVQVQKSKINLEISNVDFERFLSQMKTVFENYYELWDNINQTLPIFIETKTSAEEDLRLVQERYNLGAATILDLLNAQVSLISANSSLVRANYDEKILRAELNALVNRN
tara:strand:- start:910 stop:2184 length:1275 start_codon:yes stop_codon:yes gene_type:complete